MTKIQRYSDRDLLTCPWRRDCDLTLPTDISDVWPDKTLRRVLWMRHHCARRRHLRWRDRAQSHLFCCVKGWDAFFCDGFGELCVELRTLLTISTCAPLPPRRAFWRLLFLVFGLPVCQRDLSFWRVPSEVQYQAKSCEVTNPLEIRKNANHYEWSLTVSRRRYIERSFGIHFIASEHLCPWGFSVPVWRRTRRLCKFCISVCFPAMTPSVAYFWRS